MVTSFFAANRRLLVLRAVGFDGTVLVRKLPHFPLVAACLALLAMLFSKSAKRLETDDLLGSMASVLLYFASVARVEVLPVLWAEICVRV